MKATTKKLTLLGSVALASVVALSLGVSGIFAGALVDSEKAGRYYSDFASQEDAYAAAEELNDELAGEGIVMLKNDGSLPLEKGAKVSVLGVAQDTLNETTGSISESLSEAGFVINPTLEKKYSSDSAAASSYGDETPLTGSEKSSLSYYNDAAVIVIGRGTSGESSDRDTNTGEVESNTYLGEDTGWTHEAHDTANVYDTDGTTVTGTVEYKHELQLTESEEEIIALAEANCKKVIVLYSSGNTFEMANLEEDENINAIYWIGRLGTGGISAVGKILSGEINPSGKTVDEWTRDFTNDPTYANANPTETYGSDGTVLEIASGAGTGSADYMGYNEVDYEEDIYYGYKFYETYWAEASSSNATPTISSEEATADDWYDYNVVYPFGYGLSYTSFSYNLVSITGNDGTSITGSLASTLFSSSVENPATISSITAKIEVTNTGDVAGKETVEVYANAPYTSGSTEKAYLTLVGYAKTGLIQPGHSETIDVTFNVQDMASFDYADLNKDGHNTYELEAGTYNIYYMASSSHENFDTAACAQASFTLTGETAAHLDADDYSGNQVEAVFSDVEDDYYSMATSADTGSMISPLDATEDIPSTMLSRADMDSTMPTAPTEFGEDGEGCDRIMSDEFQAIYMNDFGIYASAETDTGAVWEKTEDDIPETWTQGTGVVGSNGMYDIILDDMAGLAVDDPLWETFMNQLTWDEMCHIVNNGYHVTEELATIGKVMTKDENGPNYTYSSSYGICWCVESIISATWNTDLCYRQGRMFGNCAMWFTSSDGTPDTGAGWYGPGMNTRRNQFAGRSPEYYSQDGLQAGYTAASVVGGATDMGVNVYIKHFAMYDVCVQYCAACTEASEQNMRENYLKPFQMAMQEGGAHATMTSFCKIGRWYSGQNYALIQKLARDEWGWTGYTVTDISVQSFGASMDGLVRAGADLHDGDLSEEDPLSGTWDATYNEGQGGVLLDDGSYSPTQWYCVRMSCQRILYNEANSLGNNNGVTVRDITLNVTVTQGVETNESIVELEGHTIDSITVISGSLGELEVTYVAESDDDESSSGGNYSGYTPYAETATETDLISLTGTVYTAGDLSATVVIRVDGWVPITVKINVTVTPSILFDDDISSLVTGQQVDTYVAPSNALSLTSYTVSITDGALPEGLKMDSDGHIYGTPTESGTYDVTFAVTSGRNTYTLGYTITVTGDSIVRDVLGFEIVNGDLYVNYTDGTSENLGTVVGADGKDGADGTDGVNGEDGSGCGSAVDLAGTAIAIAFVLAAAGVIYMIARKRRNSSNN